MLPDVNPVLISTELKNPLPEILTKDKPKLLCFILPLVISLFPIQHDAPVLTSPLIYAPFVGIKPSSWKAFDTSNPPILIFLATFPLEVKNEKFLVSGCANKKSSIG